MTNFGKKLIKKRLLNKLQLISQLYQVFIIKLFQGDAPQQDAEVISMDGSQHCIKWQK